MPTPIKRERNEALANVDQVWSTIEELTKEGYTLTAIGQRYNANQWQMTKWLRENGLREKYKELPKPWKLHADFWEFDLDEICEAIVDGASFKSIASMYGCTPTAVLAWINKSKDRRSRYDSAMAMRGHVAVSNNIELAQSIRDVETMFEADAIKTEIRTNEWLASKLARDKYGEKVAIEVDVSEGKSVTEEQMDALRRKLGKLTEASS